MIQRLKHNFYLHCGALAIALFIMFFVHLSTGFSDFSYMHLLSILMGGGTVEETLTIFDFRMVRSVLSIIIGMGIALAGAVFQTVSKNELASPGMLGVNAGAGLAVILFTYLKNPNTVSVWELPIAAIIGAGLAAAIIYYLAYCLGQNLSTYTLILSGISLSAGIHALEMLLIVRLDPEKFHQVNTWIIGNIFGNSWSQVALLFSVVAVLSIFLYSRHMDLNLLTLADETAVGLGVQLNRSRFIYLMVAVVLSACCVAFGGSISFVGLICPHIARRLVGVDHFRYLPITALIGGLLVITADWIARIIISPDEMLLGIIVAMIGAPYFLFILFRTQR